MTPHSAGAPLVSICLPLFNARRFIRSTIESVLAQRYQNWELVISDDASDDGSGDIVELFKDPRIRYLRQVRRLGPQGNWNHAVNEGRGVFRKLLCHDDLLHPDCLRRQVEAFQASGNEKTTLVACASSIISASGVVFFERRWHRRSRRIPGRIAVRQTVRSGTNLIGEPCATMFRASDWNRLGGFDASNPYAIDLDFWLRLLDLGDCYYISDCLCSFRISEQSWSFHLARDHARQFAELIERRRSQNSGSISAFDLALGRIRSREYALLRRAFYALLRFREKATNSGKPQ